MNDAALCVQEMQKRSKDWPEFYDFLLDTFNGLVEDNKVICGADNFTAWLYKSDEFFTAFSEWLKERGK